jgi:hypothetical protein
MPISKPFREGLRSSNAEQARRTLEDIGEYAVSRNSGHTEADVPRLIKEVRINKRARRLARTRQ